MNNLFKRFIKTFVGDLKKGDLVYLQDKLVSIDAVHSIQKGRGSRSFLVSAKELLPVGPDCITPPTLSVKPNSAKECYEVLETRDRHCTFMYSDGNNVILMDSTMDEVVVPKTLISPLILSMLEAGEKFRVREISAGEKEGEAVSLILNTPNLKCTIAKTMSNGSSLVAVTASGARITCPSIIQPGDRVNVDTLTGQYMSRAEHN